MNPLSDIQRGLIALAIFSLVLGGTAWALYSKGHTAGAASVQGDWDAAKLAQSEANAKLLLEHADAIALQSQRNNEINLKVTEKHENELQTLRRERDADRAAVDAAGGLRISANSCNQAAPATEAASAGQRDEAGAGTIRLPERVESGLWDLVNQADEVSGQLRSCQAWIVDNGFYGPVPSDNTSLLDRMIAEPNQPAEEPTP